MDALSGSKGQGGNTSRTDRVRTAFDSKRFRRSEGQEKTSFEHLVVHAFSVGTNCEAGEQTRRMHGPVLETSVTMHSCSLFAEVDFGWSGGVIAGFLLSFLLLSAFVGEWARASAGFLAADVIPGRFDSLRAVAIDAAHWGLRRSPMCGREDAGPLWPSRE